MEVEYYNMFYVNEGQRGKGGYEGWTIYSRATCKADVFTSTNHPCFPAVFQYYSKAQSTQINSDCFLHQP